MQFGSSALQYKKRTKVQIGEDEYERETDTFYAGQIRNRPVLSFPAGSSAGYGRAFVVYKERHLVYSCFCSDYLLLFPDVFQEYSETLCRKSEISADDGSVSEKMGHFPPGYAGEKDTSYI